MPEESTAVQEVRCNSCGCDIDYCSFCDESGCAVAICYGCMVEALGESLGPLHEHGG